MQVSCRDHSHPKAVSHQCGHEQRWSFVSLYFYTAVVQILITRAVFGQAAVTCSVTTHLLWVALYFYGNHKIKQLRWKCGMIQCNSHSRWGKQQNILERRKDGTSENTLFIHFHDYFIWTLSESGCEYSMFFTLPFNSTWNMRLKLAFFFQIKKNGPRK